MKSLIFTFFLVLIIALNIRSQYNYDSSKIRSKVLNQVNELSKAKRLEGVFIGIGGTESQIYAQYRAMREMSTAEEMRELTNHPNPILRAYAFWGLAEKKQSGILDIILKHINDTASFEALFADVVTLKNVGDFMIELVVPKYIFTADYYFTNKYSLSDPERTILDSVVIFTDNKLIYKNRVLLNVKPYPGYYKQIKELALAKNIFAVVALAKYKKEEDIELIKSSIEFPITDSYEFSKPAYYYSFKAISFFPHESFWNFLTEFYSKLSFDKYDYVNYGPVLDAFAAFQKTECIKYLSHTIPDLTYISLKSMEKFDIPMYDSLKFNIWENYSLISPAVFKHLLGVDSARAINAAFKTLEGENKYLEFPGLHFLNRPYIFRQAGEIMIDTLIYMDNKRLINLFVSKLSKAEYSELEMYCKKVNKLKNSVIINTMLNRLKIDNKVYDSDDYWTLMEGLLSFKNYTVKKKLIFTVLSNNYAVTQKNKTRESLEETIEYIERSFDHPETFDELMLEEYR